MIDAPEKARAIFLDSLPLIASECRAVLAGELHYQAMVYHALRTCGVPRSQLGMNVKQWIEAPVSALFMAKDVLKHEKFRGGFEPIPDVVIFAEGVGGDWRRRSHRATLSNMLLAAEIKVSERKRGRLGKTEVASDLEKLAAHREEARHRGGDFAPIMLVIDMAPDPLERMRGDAIGFVLEKGRELEIDVIYLDPSHLRHAAPL